MCGEGKGVVEGAMGGEGRRGKFLHSHQSQPSEPDEKPDQRARNQLKDNEGRRRRRIEEVNNPME